MMRTIPRGMGDSALSPIVGGFSCSEVDAFLGFCTLPLSEGLTTSTGAPIANQYPPAPPAGATQYSPDQQLGQMEGQATEQQLQTVSAGAQASGAASSPTMTPDASGGSSTSTWVMVAIIGTLALVTFVAVKK